MTRLDAACIAQSPSSSCQSTEASKNVEVQLINYINSGTVSHLPFSSAVVVGELVFVSGQASVDPETGKIVAGSFEEEMRRAFENLQRVLEAAGCSLKSIISIRCYVDKQERLAEFNDLYRRIITPPFPARTTLIGVLGHDFLKFEVDAIAHRGSRP
jgi:2-iminobutanoate/2-iminopropanoate deaminase